MWDNLSDEIAEEFECFNTNERSFICSYQDFSPRLNEEVDDQEWQSHSLMSRPSFISVHDTPQTCVRVSVFKWKNGYGEGKWFSANASSSWGTADYAEMAEIPSVDVWAQLKPAKPVKEIETEPEVCNTVVEPKTHRIRIQVTMRRNGEYIAGKNGNFQVQAASCKQVIEILRPLEVLWPKCVKPQSSVRVQIQDLLGGKMYGGGNYQLHNADVGPVLMAIEQLVNDAGLLVEKRKMETKKSSEGLADAWKAWSEADDLCPNCGCGTQGNCLCRMLNARV